MDINYLATTCDHINGKRKEMLVFMTVAH